MFLKQLRIMKKTSIFSWKYRQSYTKEWERILSTSRFFHVDILYAKKKIVFYEIWAWFSPLKHSFYYTVHSKNPWKLKSAQYISKSFKNNYKEKLFQNKLRISTSAFKHLTGEYQWNIVLRYLYICTDFSAKMSQGNNVSLIVGMELCKIRAKFLATTKILIWYHFALVLYRTKRLYYNHIIGPNVKFCW